MVMVFVLLWFGLVWFWIFKIKLFWVIFQSYREQSIFDLFNFFYASWMSIPGEEFPIIPLSVYLFNSLLDSIVNFICHWLISIPNLCNKKLKGFFLTFLFWVCRWEGKSLEAIQVWVETVLPSIVSTLFELSPVIFFLIEC